MFIDENGYRKELIWFFNTTSFILFYFIMLLPIKIKIDLVIESTPLLTSLCGWSVWSSETQCFWFKKKFMFVTNTHTHIHTQFSTTNFVLIFKCIHPEIEGYIPSTLTIYLFQPFLLVITLGNEEVKHL